MARRIAVAFILPSPVASQCQEVLWMRCRLRRQISTTTAQHRGQARRPKGDAYGTILWGLGIQPGFHNTYYHPSFAHIQRKTPTFNGVVNIALAVHQALELNQIQALQACDLNCADQKLLLAGMEGQKGRILSGDITDLPAKDSNIVRIFTSSTFTDTFEERNRLMRDVYPNLRTYCQRNGLEFQVVDMRWGVRDEATSDHKTSELCMQEIRNCQRLSPGPNFVCLLGNKYGYRPFPPKIIATEFEVLLEIAKETYDKQEHVQLLTEWYWKDSNAVPEEYVLQPITNKLPHYSDFTEENAELHKKAKSQWWATFEAFQRLLRAAVRVAVDRRRLTQQQMEKYFCSVTEEEVSNGILQSKNPGTQSLCYIRHLSDIDVNLHDQHSRLFTDVSEGQRDKEAQELLDRLKQERISRSLGTSNVTHFDIPWSSGGINATDRRHQEYLDTFCNKFDSDMRRLIDRSLEEGKSAKQEQSPLFKEVLQHAWFCQEKCSTFRGREDILSQITDFVKDFRRFRPLVVYGSSGSGKTSVMAVIAQRAKKQLGKDAKCIFRFLGTSPHSSSIHSTLRTVCQQICKVYDIEAPGSDILEDYSQLVRYFHTLISKAPSSADRPLVLLLDSVDQLSPANNAHAMNWLPKQCPKFVKIIISVLPDYFDILPTLRRSLPNQSSYIEVPKLSLTAGAEILDAWLEGAHRRLTNEQRDYVMSAFRKCPQPLFLKLLFVEASRWNSYTDVSRLNLGSSVTDAIRLLFERLERKHGKTLITHALGFITAARNGITESELEDVLSLDDDVIDDVYQYWDPPVEGVVRLPSLLWTRVRHDIEEFLVERQADSKTVMAWYHRQFWEASRTKYLSKDSGKVSRHALLAEYFQGTWGGGEKKPITLTRRKKTLPDADRQVSSQPVMFSKGVFNLRKLSELPHQLICANLLQTLDDEVLFNFEWLYGKVRGQTLNEVILDFVAALEMTPGDLAKRLVHDSLVLASSNVKHDVDCLAQQLIGRLLAFTAKFPRIDQLVKQATRWCYANKAPRLIPRTACLVSAGGPLKTNLRGHTQRVNCVAATKDNKFAVTSGEDSLLNIWNLNNFDCIHTLKLPGIGASCLALTGNDRFAVHSAGSSVGVWDLDTGDVVQQFDNEAKVTCFSVTPDNNHIVTGGEDGVLRVWNIGSGEKKHELTGPEGPINSVVGTTAGDVICGSQDCSVRVWNLVNGEPTGVFQAHSKPVLHVDVTTDERHAISASEDKTIRIWDMKSRDCATLKGHSGLVKCVAKMHDGRRIVSGSKDQTLRVWDLVSLECQLTLKGHTNAIWNVTVATDDSFIVSASKDDMLKVWDALTGECQQTLIGHSSWISCVAITTDCATIISGSNDKNVKLWKAAGNEHAQSINVPSDHIIHHRTQPECTAMTPEGHWGLTGSKNDSLKIWDMRSATCAKSLPGSISCLRAAHTSSLVISGSHDGSVSLWDCDDGACQRVLRGHKAQVTCVEFSTDDCQIVSASNDCTIKLWHVTGEEQLTLTGHTDAVFSLALMCNDSHVVSGSKDKSVRLWNLTTGTCEHVFDGHQGAVGCVTATKDGSVILSGSEDFTLRIWSVERKECLHTIRGYNDSIKCIAITADQHYAVAGSHEGKEQLRMWNIKSGKCVRVLEGHVHAVMNLTMLPRDRMMISSSRDGTIKVWGTATGDLIDSFDFQSQVKHFAVSAAGNNYSIIAVTKSGTVALLDFNIPRESSSMWSPEEQSQAEMVVETIEEPAQEQRCGKCCIHCKCCAKCTVV